MIGRDDDVLGQGQGRSFEDLGLVGAVADDGDDARAGLAEDVVRLLRLGRGPGRGQDDRSDQDQGCFAKSGHRVLLFDVSCEARSRLNLLKEVRSCQSQIPAPGSECVYNTARGCLPSPGPFARSFIATVAGTALWLAGHLPGALARGPGRGRSGPLRLRGLRPVCHQVPDRCFALGGHPLAVCGRCLGIYAGFAAGLALYPFVRGLSSKPALPRPGPSSCPSCPWPWTAVGRGPRALAKPDRPPLRYGLRLGRGPAVLLSGRSRSTSS